MRIFLATRNEYKVTEVSEMFRDKGLALTVLPPDIEGGMPEVDETEDTFMDNALLKAMALRSLLPVRSWILADDSGMEIDILGGNPGVRSARYAGEHASFEENNLKVLKELGGVVGNKRSARFVCYLVLIEPSGSEHIFRGACEGLIAEEMSGDTGFGYDPLFIPEGFQDTFAVLGPKKKNRMSHRAIAVGELTHWLRFVQNAFGAGV